MRRNMLCFLRLVLCLIVALLALAQVDVINIREEEAEAERHRELLGYQAYKRGGLYDNKKMTPYTTGYMITQQHAEKECQGRVTSIEMLPLDSCLLKSNQLGGATPKYVKMSCKVNPDLLAFSLIENDYSDANCAVPLARTEQVARIRKHGPHCDTTNSVTVDCTSDPKANQLLPTNGIHVTTFQDSTCRASKLVSRVIWPKHACVNNYDPTQSVYKSMRVHACQYDPVTKQDIGTMIHKYLGLNCKGASVVSSSSSSSSGSAGFTAAARNYVEDIYAGGSCLANADGTASFVQCVDSLTPELSMAPLAVPTPAPTPTSVPINVPSGQPTGQPSRQPTGQPTQIPTLKSMWSASTLISFQNNGSYADSVGSFTNPTKVGSPSLLTSPAGNAFLSLPSSPASSVFYSGALPSFPLTVCLWQYNLGAYDTSATLFSADVSTSSHLFQIKYVATTSALVNPQIAVVIPAGVFSDATAPSGIPADITTSVTPNAWHHICVTLERVYGDKVFKIQPTLYIDSRQVGSSTNIATQLTTFPTGAFLSIGSLYGSGTGFFGYLDEVHVYAARLSAAQIVNVFTKFTPDPATFFANGLEQMYYVPPGIKYLLVSVWGGGGGGAGVDSQAAQAVAYGGGSGGFTQCFMTVKPGERLFVYVGQGGSSSCTPSKSTWTNTTAGGYPDGGSSMSSSIYASVGSGGGRSAIRRGTRWAGDDIAAGGGGGGGYSCNAFTTNNLGGGGGGGDMALGNYYVYGASNSAGGFPTCPAADAAPPSFNSQAYFYVDAGNPASYPGSGTKWFDLGYGHNHMTLLSTTFDTSTASIVFAATSLAYSKPNTPNFDARTLSWWVLISDRTVGGGGFGMKSDTSTDNLAETISWMTSTGWDFGSSNNNRYGGNLGDRSYTLTSSSTGTLANGEWMMITAVYTSTGYSMYKNGLLEFTITGLFQKFSFDSCIYMGPGTYTTVTGTCGISGTPSSFVGKVGEAQVWNFPMTSAQVAQQFAATSSRYTCPEGPLIKWSMSSRGSMYKGGSYQGTNSGAGGGGGVYGGGSGGGGQGYVSGQTSASCVAIGGSGGTGTIGGCSPSTQVLYFATGQTGTSSAGGAAPGSSGISQYLPSVASGGAPSTSSACGTSGGNGLVVLSPYASLPSSATQVAAPPPARNTSTTIFTYTGKTQNYTTPSSSAPLYLHVKLWGGGGGGAYYQSIPAAIEGGGAGGYTECYLGPFVSRTTLSVIVGGGGFGGKPSAAGKTCSNSYTSSAYGGGGIAYCDSSSTYSFGSGGGRSAIQTSRFQELATAGGGGGGGYGFDTTLLAASNSGGGGGGFVGGSSLLSSGGTQVAGGAFAAYTVGNAGPGQYLQGGSPAPGQKGSGGGGGFFGGSGGGVSSSAPFQGGAGGGSGYIGGCNSNGPSFILTGQNGAQYKTLPPNSADTFYIAGVGIGGFMPSLTSTAVNAAAGGNGLVTITPIPVPLSTQASAYTSAQTTSISVAADGGAYTTSYLSATNTVAAGPCTTCSVVMTFTNPSSTTSQECLSSTITPSFSGAGGASAVSTGDAGSVGYSGGSSSITGGAISLTAPGGGGGGYYATSTSPSGLAGGSGGGGGYSLGSTSAGGAATTQTIGVSNSYSYSLPLGYAGGSFATGCPIAGSGGGGAGGVGQPCGSAATSSNGGVGRNTTIIPPSLATSLGVGVVSGSSIYFAGGGGGAVDGGVTTPAGGLGGGGTGTGGTLNPTGQEYSVLASSSGLANTGGGGGGARNIGDMGSNYSGLGGGGVVILVFASSQ